MSRVWLMVVVVVVLLFSSRELAAQTCTATVPEVYFGSLSPQLSAVDGGSSISIDCTGDRNQTLRICIGIIPAGSAGDRRMYRNGDVTNTPSIDYEIYSDAGRQQVWDDNALQEITVSLDGGGRGGTTLDVYATMVGGGWPPAGMYSSGPNDDLIVGAVKPGGSPCSSGSGGGTFVGDAFDARVLVTSSCSIQADPIDFGTVIGGMAGPIDVKGQLRTTCNQQLPYTVALNAGQVPGNTVANRKLGLNGSGPGVIDYQLFLDSGRTQVWGDGTTGAIHNDTGDGAEQIITVYGRVPVQPLPVSGTYRDTVTATITY